MASAKPKKSSRVQDILLQAGVIDELQLRSALARQANWGGRLPKTLADLGFASEEDLTAALGKALHMPVTHLGTVPRDASAMAKLDVKYCEQHGVFPVFLRDRTLQLAMADPTELDVIDEVQSKVNARVQPLLASESEILAAISKHYRNREYRPSSRGERRFTDEAVPAVTEPPKPGAAEEETAPAWGKSPTGTGSLSHSQRTEHTFELDTSAPPMPGSPGGGHPSDVMARPPSANTLLDEMMDGKAGAAPGFTRDELVRLEAARQNQEKTTTILRAVRQLLAEKGFDIG